VDIGAVVARLDRDLASAGTPERAESERRYLKSELRHYGVGLPTIRRLAKTAAAGLDHDSLVSLASALWSEPVHERRMLAATLLEDRSDLLEPSDLPVLESFIRQSRTWALVDTLAPSVTGPLFDRHPELEPALDHWSRDPDVWIRRSALLVHLRPLRAGAGDFERFGRYADAMLEEKEFFVRKAIGWVLRDTGRRRPELVYAWVAPRTHRMSGVTIREAVKRLPEPDRERLMAAHRAGRPAG
jgi:3-methyladenine DNA glycosylase AlkD